jgi:hypothetical protein
VSSWVAKLEVGLDDLGRGVVWVSELGVCLGCASGNPIFERLATRRGLMVFIKSYDGCLCFLLLVLGVGQVIVLDVDGCRTGDRVGSGMGVGQVVVWGVVWVSDR